MLLEDFAGFLLYTQFIGKNLVKMMLEGKGLTVIDLGVDVSPETFVEKAIENNAQVICCSALLTTTMVEMKNVVAKAEEKGENTHGDLCG